MPSNCATCKWRVSYDRNPRSSLGKLWKFHTRFCPGWKAYLKELPEKERAAVLARYGGKAGAERPANPGQ